MVRNGKFFVLPEGDDDFKTLFRRVAAAGGGRPVDEEGFPQGPWTPQLLAEAISRIEANRAGIEPRTVQLWFDDNDKGVSAENIRWLARVFGCDDPEATSAWQAALGVAQARLVARRRLRGRVSGPGSDGQVLEGDADPPATAVAAVAPPRQASDGQGQGKGQHRGVALRTEALFSLRSPLDLPAAVFAGAVALGFLSTFLGIHSATYVRADGVAKQVGFLWAPNWTFLFMAFLPLFFAFAGELVVFWRSEGRPILLAADSKTDRNSAESDAGWARKVEASSATYWVVLVICVGFAGVFQWISVRLIPLLRGGDDYATDWGSLANVRPDVVSVPQAVAFTGLANLYMCLCFALFFAGLVLLHTVAHDVWELDKASRGRPSRQGDGRPGTMASAVGLRVMRGIVRCTLCGLLVAICMKLQSSYLTTSAESVWRWLVQDARSVLPGPREAAARGTFRMPEHFTSLLVVAATCVVFLHGFLRVGQGGRLDASLGRMAAAVALLVAGYLLVDAFAGFSVLLAAAVSVALYGLFDPGFGVRAPAALEGR